MRNFTLLLFLPMTWVSAESLPAQTETQAQTPFDSLCLLRTGTGADTDTPYVDSCRKRASVPAPSNDSLLGRTESVAAPLTQVWTEPAEAPEENSFAASFLQWIVSAIIGGCGHPDHDRSGYHGGTSVHSESHNLFGSSSRPNIERGVQRN